MVTSSEVDSCRYWTSSKGRVQHLEAENTTTARLWLRFWTQQCESVLPTHNALVQFTHQHPCCHSAAWPVPLMTSRIFKNLCPSSLPWLKTRSPHLQSNCRENDKDFFSPISRMKLSPSRCESEPTSLCSEFHWDMWRLPLSPPPHTAFTSVLSRDTVKTWNKAVLNHLSQVSPHEHLRLEPNQYNSYITCTCISFYNTSSNSSTCFPLGLCQIYLYLSLIILYICSHCYNLEFDHPWPWIAVFIIVYEITYHWT